MTRATLLLLGEVHAPEEGLEAGVGAEGIEDFSVLLGRSMPFYQFCGLCGTSCQPPPPPRQARPDGQPGDDLRLGGQCVRHTAAEKYELIRLVEGSDLPARQTLRELRLNRSTF